MPASALALVASQSSFYEGEEVVDVGSARTQVVVTPHAAFLRTGRVYAPDWSGLGAGPYGPAITGKLGGIWAGVPVENTDSTNLNILVAFRGLLGGNGHYFRWGNWNFECSGSFQMDLYAQRAGSANIAYIPGPTFTSNQWMAVAFSHNTATGEWYYTQARGGLEYFSNSGVYGIGIDVGQVSIGISGGMDFAFAAVANGGLWTRDQQRELVFEPRILLAPSRIWVPQTPAVFVPTLTLPTIVPGSLSATGWRGRITAS